MLKKLNLFGLLALSLMIAHCPGGSGMPGNIQPPPSPCSGPDCGLNANIPQSLYVQVPNETEASQFYLVDIEPNQGAADSTSKSLKGFKAKNALAGHVKGSGGNLIGVTPF